MGFVAHPQQAHAPTDDTISLHAHRAPADPRAARLALTTILRRKGSVLDAMARGLYLLHKDLTPEVQFAMHAAD